MGVASNWRHSHWRCFERWNLGVVFRLQRRVARVVSLQSNALGVRHRLTVPPGLVGVAVAEQVHEHVLHDGAGVLVGGQPLVDLFDEPTNPRLRGVREGDVSLGHCWPFRAGRHMGSGVRRGWQRSPESGEDRCEPSGDGSGVASATKSPVDARP
jgi:hypothetical protein